MFGPFGANPKTAQHQNLRVGLVSTVIAAVLCATHALTALSPKPVNFSPIPKVIDQVVNSALPGPL
jgi:hypothetical protein